MVTFQEQDNGVFRAGSTHRIHAGKIFVRLRTDVLAGNTVPGAGTCCRGLSGHALVAIENMRTDGGALQQHGLRVVKRGVACAGMQHVCGA